LAHLGHAAAYVSCVPGNALAERCVGDLRRYGVDVEHLLRGDGRMGMYFLTHGAGHRPAEVLYDRASSAFALAEPGRYDWAAILAGADWLHVSGITPAVSETAATCAYEALARARTLGLKTSFDCNYRARLWGQRAARAPSWLDKFCAQADLVFGDERDIALITGMEQSSGFDGAAAAGFARWPNIKYFATTSRGAEQADEQTLSGILCSRAEVRISKCHALGHIVDRIGSGDAYAAGVIDQLLNGADLARAVEFATAAACLKHSVPGDFNLVRRSDIEAVLAEARVDVKR
jgi:2-dehydro-3-deoxygluconokinase